MESNELRQSLHEAERAEASTWIDYPPTPGWWSPLFGVWAFALGLNLAYVDGPVQGLVSLALTLVMVGLVVWQRRYRGTYPTGKPPREFVAPFVMLFGGAIALALASAAVAYVVAGWVGALLAGALAWALVEWYERRYAADAARVRARLAAEGAA